MLVYYTQIAKQYKIQGPHILNRHCIVKSINDSKIIKPTSRRKYARFKHYMNVFVRRNTYDSD